MLIKHPRKYFIVKHDLHSFQALPGIIWRTRVSRNKYPRCFKQVKKGDRWVEFAYVKDEINYEPCSLVAGFYECTREARHGDIPLHRKKPNWNDDWADKAWMIEGKRYGEQLRYKQVSVPSIQDMLGRKVFGRVTILSIRAKEFERIRKIALSRQLNPKTIPILGREPLNEQEVLSVVVGGHRALGINKIIGVQTRFPDMLVKINNKNMYLELEYDSQGLLGSF